MSGTVVSIENKGIEVFDPEKAKRRDAQADSVIAYAKRVKDWPSLEAAVERKLKDQAKFVEWWGKAVTPQQGPGRGHKTNADPRLFSVAKAEKQTGIKQQQVSKWKHRLAEPERYRAMLYGTAYAAAMASANVKQSVLTGNPHWYTPAEYIEAARLVLSGINVDPASCAAAQEIVQAEIWFDEKSDGLTQEWHGNVYLNPPYSFLLISRFTEKLITELDAGRASAAILLTNNNTDAANWQAAARRSSAVCFTAGRIRFWNESGVAPSPVCGQTFFYFGPERRIFGEIFGKFGVVL